MTKRCWLARYAPDVPCEGRLVRAHLIPRQLLYREVWRQRDRINKLLEASGRPPLPRRRSDFIWDPAVWVWACGGPVGNGGHHGMLDHSRTLRVPLEDLPARTVQAAARMGLWWWLEREYGGRR